MHVYSSIPHTCVKSITLQQLQQRGVKEQELRSSASRGEPDLPFLQLHYQEEEEGEEEGEDRAAQDEGSEEQAFRTALFQRGSSSLRAPDAVFFHLPGELEQQQQQQQQLELEHGGGAEYDEEEEEEGGGGGGGREGGQEGLGFRPMGGLEEGWLARQTRAHFQRQFGSGWRRRGRGTGGHPSRLFGPRRGLSIHSLVEVHKKLHILK